ncbi:GNAT family protein [Tissierella sp.]|uniref:GNAT family N-acetyltransferase n=1 Tax=Tissierella sp. TaxID=41274 RepID=UPI00286DF7B4|nr:GNAT family protein [Tissierella sp.]
MFIETERLVLRKFQEDDFNDFCEYAMDDEMCRMMGRRLMHSREDALWNFEWLKDKEERCYGLVYKDTGRIIGNLTVCAVPKELLKLEELKGKVGKSMSFSISKNYQRKGLMLEAVTAVVKHLFDIEGMDYIQCGHFPFNTASEMLQKKLGFKYLTTQRFDDEGIEVTSVENILWKVS